MMSNGKGLTPEQLFFLSPEKPLHRQYEALRAYFVKKIRFAHDFKTKLIRLARLEIQTIEKPATFYITGCLY
jgi:hypothetical protein